MVHAKVCYQDCKRFTKRRKRPILFECTTVSEEEMVQEDVAHLILDEHDEDEILDIDIES